MLSGLFREFCARSTCVEFLPYKNSNNITPKRMEKITLKIICYMNKHESLFDNSHMDCIVRLTCATRATFCQESQKTICIDF